MADTVIHDESGSRFVLMRGDQQIGEAGYETREDGGIVFTHTEVDQELQERGLGSTLVGSALDQLRTSTDVRIGATCPFVRRYLEEHPEYGDLTNR
ncbi:GNAT family N-acetyltransferase [Pseudolysinimonas sp.]|jgi:predicted GNAT family acetyltransferase|uniref:GNAT family N-acetyltransferase n=1 Tax=Pseudolysinimonas sp. TaxID=2680009 RepID=UPI00378308F1